jgi:hypothetical protein
VCWGNVGEEAQSGPRTEMIDDLREDSFVKMKRKLKEENIGENGCQRPAYKAEYI